MQQELFSKIGTVIFVTLLSALVWLYAEGRSVTETPRPVTIRFVAPAGQDLLIARIDEQNRPITRDLTVEVSVLASRNAISKLDRLISQPIAIEVTPSATALIQTLDLTQALNRSGFAAEGVNITGINQKQVRIHVEPMTTLDNVPVAVRPPLGMLAEEFSTYFEVPPEPNPATVQLKLPQSMANEIETPLIFAPFSDTLFEQYTSAKGVEHNPVVTLQLPDEVALAHALSSSSNSLPLGVSIKPAKVNLRFTLKNTISSEVTLKDPIPVWVQGPPAIYDLYDIQLADGQASTVTLTVKGPAESIDLITSGQFKPRVVLEVTSESIAGKSRADAQPRILLPEGVTVVSRDPNNDLWTLVITPRQGSSLETP